jgi:hypothetical protein
MSEFHEMIKEAFVGEEPWDPTPGREALEAAIAKFERRDRALRWMSWLSVAFMGAVCVAAAWGFLAADEGASTKRLILYATLFLFAGQGVGWSKMFLFTTQQSFSIQKELRRARIAWLEER